MLFIGADGHGVVHVPRTQTRRQLNPAEWQFRLARLADPAPAPLRRIAVYRLIAKDTIEEKVLALANRKAELFRGVMNDGNTFGAALTADDIRALIA